MIAYKLMRLRKDGTLGPLFINAKQRVPVGEWLVARGYITKGFKWRPGWHCTARPFAPHLSEKGRVWTEVSVVEPEVHQRPESQGGLWYTAQIMKVNRVLTATQVAELRESK